MADKAEGVSNASGTPERTEQNDELAAKLPELITKLKEEGVQGAKTAAEDLLSATNYKHVEQCLDDWEKVQADDPKKNRLQDWILREKQWTMLVYMAGDNNLTEEMVWGLQEMKKTLEDPDTPNIDRDVGVIAQYDPSGLNPRLLYLNKGSVSRLMDGDLDAIAERPQDFNEVCESIAERLKPTSEHWAIAIWHHHRGTLQSLIDYLSQTPRRAGEKVLCGPDVERFIFGLLTCNQQATKKILQSRDMLALALAETMEPRLTLSNLPPPVDETYRAEVEKHFNKLDISGIVRDDKKVGKLAERLAGSSNSVISNLRNLSSPLMIQDFIERQAREVANNGLKANQYLVVLSGHGGGATGDFLPDDDPPSALTIPQLGEMLEMASKAMAKSAGRSQIAILGLDSCLMSMAEVAYEVQDSVQYLVGSEGFVANTGWPYHRILEVLGDAEAPLPTAWNLVERYAAFYHDYEMGGSSTHLAALQLEYLGKVPQTKTELDGVENDVSSAEPNKEENFRNLATAIRFLADSLIEALKPLDDDEEYSETRTATNPTGRDDAPKADRDAAVLTGRKVRDALILAHWYAQSFNFEKYVDLWDFCNQLVRFLPRPDERTEKISDYCRAVQYWIKEKAVVRSLYCGPEFQHAHGVSVFFPWSVKDFTREYSRLKFARDTHWHDFIREYLRKTRRLRRAYVPDAQWKPRRPESDVQELLHEYDSPWETWFDLDWQTRHGSPWQARHGSPWQARHGSPWQARHGSPWQARHGSPWQARMVAGGKAFPLANVKNPPDGYFRQHWDTRNKYVDEDGAQFPFQDGVAGHHETNRNEDNK